MLQNQEGEVSGCFKIIPLKIFFSPTKELLVKIPKLSICSFELELEDFFTLKDLLIRGLEEFNNFQEENNLFIQLKSDPNLFKIRIGKKKTGLPNEDFPPLLMEKKLRNCNFSVFSIEYGEEHVINLLENKKDFLDNEISTKKSKGKNKDLKEKFLPPSDNNNRNERNLKFNETIMQNEVDEIDRKKKSCCEKCLIF